MGEITGIRCKPPHDREEYARNPLRLKDRKGADPAEWPADLRIQEFPVEHTLKQILNAKGE